MAKTKKLDDASLYLIGMMHGRFDAENDFIALFDEVFEHELIMHDWIYKSKFYEWDNKIGYKNKRT